MCQDQIEEIPSLITHQLGMLAHASRSCGPVYDITSISPVERLMWFIQKIDGRGIPVANNRLVAKVSNGKSKT